jgi:hypothetical protein
VRESRTLWYAAQSVPRWSRAKSKRQDGSLVLLAPGPQLHRGGRDGGHDMLRTRNTRKKTTGEVQADVLLVRKFESAIRESGYMGEGHHNCENSEGCRTDWRAGGEPPPAHRRNTHAGGPSSCSYLCPRGLLNDGHGIGQKAMKTRKSGNCPARPTLYKFEKRYNVNTYRPKNWKLQTPKKKISKKNGVINHDPK